MISLETTESFIADIGKSESNEILSMVADFSMSEPYMVAFMSTLFQAVKFEESFTAALTAVSYYEKIRLRQIQSDELKEEMG